MKWIKASERNPTKDGYYYSYRCEDKVYAQMAWWYNDEQEWSTGVFEWLDESLTPDEDDWVSVEDGVGEPITGRYNVCLQNGIVFEMDYSSLSHRWFKIGVGDESPENKVTHYRLLPTPPKK